MSAGCLCVGAHYLFKTAIPLERQDVSGAAPSSPDEQKRTGQDSLELVGAACAVMYAIPHPSPLPPPPSSADERLDALVKLLPTLEKGSEDTLLPYIRAHAKDFRFDQLQAERLACLFTEKGNAEACLKLLISDELVRPFAHNLTSFATA